MIAMRIAIVLANLAARTDSPRCVDGSPLASFRTLSAFATPSLAAAEDMATPFLAVRSGVTASLTAAVSVRFEGLEAGETRAIAASRAHISAATSAPDRGGLTILS